MEDTLHYLETTLKSILRCDSCFGAGHLGDFECYDCSGTGLINRGYMIDLSTDDIWDLYEAIQELE